MFVCGGENIYPGEVEKVLGTHPLVQNTCVVPVDDDIKGKKPVAYVVKKGNVTEEELKRFDLLMLRLICILAGYGLSISCLLPIRTR